MARVLLIYLLVLVSILSCNKDKLNIEMNLVRSIYYPSELGDAELANTNVVEVVIKNNSSRVVTFDNAFVLEGGGENQVINTRRITIGPLKKGLHRVYFSLNANQKKQLEKKNLKVYFDFNHGLDEISLATDFSHCVRSYSDSCGTKHPARLFNLEQL